MSKLAETLEELQRDILQGDLKNNPYLQGSNVPILDKELKTKAKKIIPAINELLNMVNTFTDGMENFMENVQKDIYELHEEVRAVNEEIKGLKNNDKDIALMAGSLNNKYDECFKKAAEIELDVETIKKVCKCYKNIDMGSDFMELKMKVKLGKDKAEKIICAEELYDPEKQIKVYAYDARSKKYKFIDFTFTQDINSSSVYEFNVRPLELQIDGEEGDVVLVNRSSWELIVFIYI